MKKLQNANLGLLLIRIALAAVFLVHGIMKLSNIDGTVGFFGMLGLAPAFAYAVAIVEVVGGALLLVGFQTLIAGIALAVVMVGAIFLAKMGKGFTGLEFELVLALASLGLGLTGPGKYAIETCPCMECMCSPTAPKA